MLVNAHYLEDIIEMVQGRNGGYETRNSILAICRNNILFAYSICNFHLATRIPNGIGNTFHQSSCLNLVIKPLAIIAQSKPTIAAEAT